ncbi:hypothetical protein ACFOY4_31420 [Actinomadura syzygii]|uniref:Lipopolysaccharide biosynthesis protein n=1 Tax=Actinomadura syzygii TaxID=1427538 RepID=A0A5D0UCL3_9ACTN|nr:lipopolysaccharide biosynthesis protein [Actinomadura syzygii]TYC15355.1 lipopolysaccharide biosynthesis protein [Actinomadura syzygii]
MPSHDIYRRRASRRRGNKRRGRAAVPVPGVGRALLAAVLRRFGPSLAFVVAGFLGGLGYVLLVPATYTANAYVLVVNDARTDGPAAVNFAQTFGRLAPLPETLGYSALPLPAGAGGAPRDHVRASTSPDTPLIELTGSAPTSRAAAAFANAAADALVRYGAAHRAETGVRVAPMSRAVPPGAPASPNPVLGVGVGTASGVLLAGLSAAALSGRRPARRRTVPRVLIAGPADAELRS